MYTVRLESSLSKATHEFTQPEIELVANISYKHITFKFEPKVRNRPVHNLCNGDDFINNVAADKSTYA